MGGEGSGSSPFYGCWSEESSYVAMRYPRFPAYLPAADATVNGRCVLGGSAPFSKTGYPLPFLYTGHGDTHIFDPSLRSSTVPPVRSARSCSLEEREGGGDRAACVLGRSVPFPNAEDPRPTSPSESWGYPHICYLPAVDALGPRVPRGSDREGCTRGPWDCSARRRWRNDTPQSPLLRIEAQPQTSGCTVGRSIRALTASTGLSPTGSTPEPWECLIEPLVGSLFAPLTESGTGSVSRPGLPSVMGWEGLMGSGRCWEVLGGAIGALPWGGLGVALGWPWGVAC